MGSPEKWDDKSMFNTILCLLGVVLYGKRYSQPLFHLIKVCTAVFAKGISVKCGCKKSVNSEYNQFIGIGKGRRNTKIQAIFMH